MSNEEGASDEEVALAPATSPREPGESRSVRRAKARETVPLPGQGRRWYDLIYRAVSVFSYKSPSNTSWPSIVSNAANRIVNRISAINRFQLELAMGPEPWDSITIPIGEEITTPAFWVAELFTPSYVGALESWLDKRGLDRVREDRGNAEFLVQVRQQQAIGAWTRLASFQNPDGQWMLVDCIRANLPVGIDYIQLHMLPIGTSLTCVAAFIYLKQDASVLVNAELHRQHPSRKVRRGDGFAITAGTTVAAEAVREERRRLHGLGRQWLSNELPGVFATESSLEHPVLDLVVTNVHDPFDMTAQLSYEDMLGVLGIGRHDWSILSSPELPGVRLEQYASGASTGRYESSPWALITRLKDAFGQDDEFEGYMGRTPRSIASRIEEEAVALLSRLSISALLDLKTQQVSRSRDLASRTYARRHVGT